MTSYPVEDILNPRVFIYSSNTDALVLQTPTSETRLRFYNDRVSPNSTTSGYLMSYSNEHFTVSKDENLIALYTIDQNRAQVTVPGRVSTKRLEIASPDSIDTKKSIVLADFNYSSPTQFVGMGYTNARLEFQIPATANQFAFLTGADAYSSYELMRIQRSSTGITQIGIGTTVISSNTTALQIAGNIVVQGDIAFNDSKYVQRNPDTGLISTEQLPQNILLLNSNNKIDQSFIPPVFSDFQYLRAQKNVGIGTRRPLQKLHVNGSTYITDRIGIGASNPISRVHAYEDASPNPTIVSYNNASGSLFRGYQNSNVILDVSSGVGIGTTIVNGKKLRVIGTSDFSDTMTCQTVQSTYVITDRFTIPNVLYQEVIDNGDTVLRNEVPVIFNNRISMNQVYSSTPLNPNIIFQNTTVTVNGNIVCSGDILKPSDTQIKTNIERISDALSKIERIGGYTYNMQRTGSRSVGVLAQEVISVLPEAVHTVSVDDANIMSVSYDAITGLLVECVRELHSELKAIKAHIGM